MKEKKEEILLAAIKKSELKKKRVTFFLTEEAKLALATWCKSHDVTESGAVEEMIRSTLPEKYFQER